MKGRNILLLAFAFCLVITPLLVYNVCNNGFIHKYIYEGTNTLPIDEALFLDHKIEGFDIVSISKETAHVKYKFTEKSLDLHRAYGLKYTHIPFDVIMLQMAAIFLIFIFGFSVFIYLLCRTSFA